MRTTNSRPKPTRILLGTCLTLTLATTAFAAEPQQNQTAISQRLEQLENTVQTQRRQIQQLTNSPENESTSTYTDRQVQDIVSQVMTDARTRQAISANSPAGYDGGFYLQSQDGNFKTRINFTSQFRYISTNADVAPGRDDQENGFQFRRLYLDFRGHALTPKLRYRLQLAGNRSDRPIDLNYAYVDFDATDILTVRFGQFKPRYSREEMVSSTAQIASERSYANDYFSIDYSQGVELQLDLGKIQPSISVFDGSYAPNTNYNADRTDFAIAGRVQALLAGETKQFKDFTSWTDSGFGLLAGAAVAYEHGETGGGTHTANVLKYTADLSVEFGGAGAFLAVHGQMFDDNNSAAMGGIPSNLDGADQFAIVGQANTFILPDRLDIFGRYEHIWFDNAYYRKSGSGLSSTANIMQDQLGMITTGLNYYFMKHNAKLTLDMIYALDPVPASNSGAGLLSSTDDGQVAIRSQFQIKF